MSLLRSTDEYLLQLREEQVQVGKDKLLGNRVYSTDVSVAVYQQKLNRIIHPNPPLVIDGQKGARTVEAIYKLQNKYKLIVNGEFDEQTIEVLMKHDPLRDLKVHTDYSSKLDLWELANTLFSDLGLCIIGILGSCIDSVHIDGSIKYGSKNTPKYIKEIKKFIKTFLDRDLDKLLQEALNDKNYFTNKLKNAYKELTTKDMLSDYGNKIRSKKIIIDHIKEIKSITDKAFPHIFKVIGILGKFFKFLNFVPALDLAYKSYRYYNEGNLIEGHRYLTKVIFKLIEIFTATIAIGTLITAITALCAQAALPAIATTLILVLTVVIISVLFYFLFSIINKLSDDHFNQYTYV